MSNEMAEFCERWAAEVQRMVAAGEIPVLPAPCNAVWVDLSDDAPSCPEDAPGTVPEPGAGIGGPVGDAGVLARAGEGADDGRRNG